MMAVTRRSRAVLIGSSSLTEADGWVSSADIIAGFAGASTFGEAIRGLRVEPPQRRRLFPGQIRSAALLVGLQEPDPRSRRLRREGDRALQRTHREIGLALLDQGPSEELEVVHTVPEQFDGLLED